MNYNANELNVVYCCSDLFSEVCAVSIASLFENNKHFADISVFIIDDKISDKSKQRFEEMAQSYHRSVFFIPLPDPSAFYNDSRFTIKSLGHTYARMALGELIPQNVERIISLDSDTMVLDRVDALWTTDMGESPIAGVDDCMGKKALVKTQHLREDTKHCNAGMFLIDLSTWRKENWTELFHQYIKNQFDSGIALGGYEEEVINKQLSERMLLLHPRNNLMTLEQVLTYDELLRFREPLKYYSHEEIEEAKKNPIITHTTNFFYVKKRIFEEGSDHPMRERYVHYRAITPWRNDMPMEVKSSRKNWFMKRIWHVMPRFVALRLANFVRNEIRCRLVKKRDDE